MIRLFRRLHRAELHLLLQIVLEFLQRIVFGNGFCEIIIHFRNDFALHVDDMRRKFRILSRQIFDEIIFRECDLHRHIIARFVADELIFKARDERFRADFQRIRLAFAAGKFFPVHRAFEIDDGVIALRERGPFRDFQTCILLRRFRELCHDIFIGNFRMLMRDGQAFIFTECDFRFLHERCRIDSAFRFGEFRRFHFGTRDRRQLFAVERTTPSIIDQNIFRFARQAVLANVHLQNLARRFPFAETFQIDARRNIGNGTLESFLDFFRPDFDRHFHFMLIDRFCFYVHNK